MKRGCQVEITAAIAPNSEDDFGVAKILVDENHPHEESKKEVVLEVAHCIATENKEESPHEFS